MEGMAFVFFIIFALVLVILYLSIRREWLPPSQSAATGVVLSVILMTLTSLAQKNPPFQAIIVGTLLGIVFSGATLVAAWYFHNQEMRTRYAERDYDEAGQ